MIRREILFERLWSQLEAGTASREDVLDRALPVGLEGAIAVARALQRKGSSVSVPDLDLIWRQVRAEMDAPAGAVETHPGVLVSHRRWPLRIAAAVAAAVVLLAAVSRQAVPGSGLYPVRLTMERVAVTLDPNSGGLRLRVAAARLHDLLVALDRGPRATAPDLARALVANRSAAMARGANVTHLDALVASQVPPALARNPASLAREIRGILGALLPTESPSAPPGAGSPLGSSGGGGSKSGKSGHGDSVGAGTQGGEKSDGRQGQEHDAEHERSHGHEGSGSGEGSGSQGDGQGHDSGGGDRSGHSGGGD